MAEPIVVERSFSAPTEALWRAVTEPAAMRRWYFEQIEEFRTEIGFATSFDVASGGRVFRHRWRVVEVLPGRLLAYTWRYDGYPGTATTAWKLLETPEGSRPLLTCTGIEPFPREIPEFTRESCRAGWEYFLQRRLPAFLDPRS